MKETAKRLITVALLLIGFAVSGSVFAETTPGVSATGTIETGAIDLIVPLPGGPTQVTEPESYLRIVFLYGIGLAALLAFAQLVIGAVQYTASAGFPSLQESSKARMKDAIVGLILLVSAITILMLFNNSKNKGLDPLPKNQTIQTPSSIASARQEEIGKYRNDPEYRARYNGTMDEMRQTWKNKWTPFRDQDPGDQKLYAALIKTLADIEDNASYNWDTNPAGRVGYLAARQKMFSEGRLFTSGGGTYSEAAGLYEKYKALRGTPPAWAALSSLDMPK